MLLLYIVLVVWLVPALFFISRFIRLSHESGNLGHIFLVHPRTGIWAILCLVGWPIMYGSQLVMFVVLFRAVHRLHPMLMRTQDEPSPRDVTDLRRLRRYARKHPDFLVGLETGIRNRAHADSHHEPNALLIAERVIRKLRDLLERIDGPTLTVATPFATPAAEDVVIPNDRRS